MGTHSLAPGSTRSVFASRELGVVTLRHDDEPPIYDDDAQTLQPIMALNLPPEPPVVEDDTRPNPTAKREPEPAPDLPSGDEPDFLDWPREHDLP